MPPLVPWLTLFLSAAMLWPRSTRWAALAPLAVTYGWAFHKGSINVWALLWISLLLLAGYLVCAAAHRLAKPAGHLLFILLAIGLSLHLLPGFHNLLAIPPERLSPNAAPFRMFLNLDKPLLAFWIILVLRPPMRGSSWRGTLAVGLTAGAASALICLGIAAFAQWIQWQPQWPPQGWIWLANNALLVTLTEEALFRGYLQQQLSLRWRQHAWGGYAALGLGALAFGMAHLPGGWPLALLAGLAGLFFGVAFRHGGLAAAVLAHLSLNVLHFAGFTYPWLASTAS